MAKSDSERRLRFLIVAGLIVATLAIYWQVDGHEFISLYDDNVYVTSNAQVQAGLTTESIQWAFTTGYAANWHPLTWLSHMLDYEFFGLNPKGHHLVSVFFHLLNTVLLFHVFWRMTGAVWKSGFVAALFALHPLHVESVAWVAERKDVLSTFFWLITMWAYVSYTEQRTLKRYLLVCISLTLGLMSKPMLVTLPFVLLLLDYWPLQRMKIGKAGDRGGTESQKYPEGIRGKVKFSRLLLEKVPLLLLVAGSSVVTLVVQGRGGAVESWESLPIGQRVANALVSYLTYIRKMVWPSDLAVFYPHLGMTLALWQVALAVVVVIGISVLVIWSLRLHPYLSVGWFWYLGTLVPVIGLVQVGSQSLADRYTYVPLIGVFVMLAWGIPPLVSRWRLGKIVMGISGAAVILLLTVLTWAQIGHWRSNMTLFQHAIDVTEQNGLAQNNVAMLLAGEGRTPEAIQHYKEAIRINPESETAHVNLAGVLGKLGRNEEAIEHYKEALRINPDHPNAHNNLGILLAAEGRMDEAAKEFREAIRVNNGSAQAHYNLGLVLVSAGKLEEAIGHYLAAERINPNDAEVHNDLGLAFAEQGKFPEAISQYREALRLKPNHAEARANLERLLQNQRRQ